MIFVTVTIVLPFLLLLQTNLWPGRAGRTVVAPSIIGTAFYQKAKLFSNDKIYHNHNTILNSIRHTSQKNIGHT